MDKEEIFAYLRDNLRIKLKCEHDHNYDGSSELTSITVTLSLEGEEISESVDYPFP